MVGATYDRLHLTRTRLTGLVALALVALLAGAAYGALRPPTYTATTTVFVARVVSQDSGGSIDTSIADFETALKLPSVESATVAQTGAGLSQVKAVTFNRAPSSSAVEVSAQGTSSRLASLVATTASRNALRTLAQQQLDGANDQVTAADQAVTAAKNALTKYNQAHGVDDVNSVYQSTQEQILQIQNDEANGTAGGDAQSQLAAAQSTLSTLASALPQWQVLDTDLTQAEDALSTVTANQTAARGDLDAVNSSSVLTASTLTHGSRLTSVLRIGVSSAVVLLVLGLLVLLAIDWLRRPAPATHRRTHRGGAGALSRSGATADDAPKATPGVSPSAVGPEPDNGSMMGGSRPVLAEASTRQTTTWGTEYDEAVPAFLAGIAYGESELRRTQRPTS